MVSHNEIEFVRENQYSSTHTEGIRVITCHSDVIDSNSIDGEGSFVTPTHFGIYYEVTRNTNVKCNDIEDFTYGFTGSGSCPTTTLTYQIQLDWNSGHRQESIFKITSGTCGAGIPSLHTAPLSLDRTPQTASLSKFLIDNDNSCGKWPCPIGPAAVSGIWFKDETGADSTCGIPVVPPIVSESDLEDKVLYPGSFSDYGDQLSILSLS